MKIANLNGLKNTGTYVVAKDWNGFMNDENTVLIDTRNDYETNIGSFGTAIIPNIRRFSDFPQWWHNNKEKFIDKRIGMFCTGGIRCEKSTAFLKTQGMSEVYHLQGGILSYLEHTPKDESQWYGGCFVFDERVAVENGMETTGNYELCRGCRQPLSQLSKSHRHFEQGVSCHRCYDKTSEQQKAGFRMRQKQFEAKLKFLHA